MSKLKLFNYDLSNLVCYFLAYSFIGWCIETIYASILNGTLTSRGYLLGPFCPIYGFGGLILLVLLKPVRHNVFLFFIGAVLMTTTLEFITSVLLEALFHSSWWDYSTEPFNLQGRICLRNSLIWGFTSVTVIKLFHPFIAYGVRRIPVQYKAPVTNLILSYFLVDTTLSTIPLVGVDLNFKHIHEISNKIYSEIEYLKDMVIK